MFESLKSSMPKETFELFSKGLAFLPEIKRWTLVGGTALAIHYQHRLSEDLDFFIKNSTLRQDRKRIDKMIENLEKKGFEAVKIYEDESQIDFEINGVKVTFFASSLNILKKDNIYFENIAVAGIETIKAMKIDVILNHRILSRDFFDIATIMKQEELTIFDLLDSYLNSYTKKLSPSLILERLTQRNFEPSDPGLSAMKPKSNFNPFKFRQDLAFQIKEQAQKDTKIINSIISNHSIIQKYLHIKFGLSRMNLLQKLAMLGEDSLVLKALDVGDFDIGYKDMSGKILLDYYLENETMFAKILGYAKEIPNEWLQSRKFKSYGKDKLIALENSIISCVKNRYNSKEKIERIASKYHLKPEELLYKIKVKENFLKNRYYQIN